MKILVSTALLSPYRVDWLNELGKYAEVNILYLEEANIERNQEWLGKRPQNCSYSLMKGRYYPKIGKISYDFIKEVREGQYDIYILDGYGYATQVLNIEYLHRHKKDFFVNVDGIVLHDNENPLIACMKKKLISKIPYFMCGSKTTGTILKNYGAVEKNIIYHPFTSLFKKDIFPEICDKREKEELRKKLGIEEDKIIISVGRFSYLGGYGKGYDVLLRAAQLLPQNVGWYIVGGKPTEEFERLTLDAGLHNIHYIDFKQKHELQEYYRLSDLFVLMTVGDVWGLVVNEAMACGLPVITTDKCVAGIELVCDGKNGYIVEVGNEKKFVEKVKKLLDCSEVADEMGKISIEIIKEYTVENMARIHMNYFEKYLGERDGYKN